MIAVYRWDGDSKVGCWQPKIEMPQNGVKGLSPNEVWWIDLEDPSEEEENLIFQTFLPVHKLTLEDITKLRREPEQGSHYPKVEEFPDYLFVIVNPIRTDIDHPIEGQTRSQRRTTNVQLSVVLNRNVLITHHYSPLNSISTLKQFLYRHSVHASRGPDYLFHLILDEMVDEYSPVLDKIANRLDRIEIVVFQRAENRLLSRLIRLKRRVISLRKTLILEREVLARLMRGEFELVDEREIVYYRNVYDHLVRYTELIEGSREMISDLMQTHLAAVSNKLNQVMKALAMISTIVMPMTLVAGIYGMNFHKGMPELDWDFGYPFALGLMVISATVSVGFFYWKKWF